MVERDMGKSSISFEPSNKNFIIGQHQRIHTLLAVQGKIMGGPYWEFLDWSSFVPFNECSRCKIILIDMHGFIYQKKAHLILRNSAYASHG